MKVLREEVKHPVIIKKDHAGSSYDPRKNPYDQIFTFIVCKKLSFNISNLSTEINKLYGDSTEYRHRHNLILSVEDGLLAYCDNNGKTMMYPVMGNTKLKIDLLNREKTNMFILNSLHHIYSWEQQVRQFCIQSFLITWVQLLVDIIMMKNAKILKLDFSKKI